jgi:hypothetical protein
VFLPGSNIYGITRILDSYVLRKMLRAKRKEKKLMDE